MNVAPRRNGSKHLFEKAVDTEHVFVMGCRHGEHRFDARTRVDVRPGAVTPATYNFSDAVRPADERTHQRKDLPMTALLTAPLPDHLDDELPRPGRPELRLVPAPERRGLRSRPVVHVDDWTPAPVRAPRRRVSVEVRRRRTLLAMMGLALALLAFPLSGSGGTSHTTGSASAAPLHPGTYVVRAGDSLWSIAERVDPSGDPRPIVSQLASELGTYTVVPGEQVTIP
jgi:nucleoid-associated protein YgaU